jgi:hypothetical protein
MLLVDFLPAQAYKRLNSLVAIKPSVGGSPMRWFSLIVIVAAVGTLAVPAAPTQQANVVRMRAAAKAGQEAGGQQGRVRLRLDDGSAEETLLFGIEEKAPNMQVVFLNRFTPRAEQLPLAIDTIQILFRTRNGGGGPGMRKGLPFEALIYLDPSGSGDPSQTTLVLRQAFETRPSDTRLQKIRLSSPVLVESGDVWVGYTNTVSASDPTRIFYHGALDTTGESEQRSWAFYNPSSGEPFSGESLAEAGAANLIDDCCEAGNWIIRARGVTGE